MSTYQSAMNGLKRSLDYVESQNTNDSNFYSSGVNNLKEIRDIASKVMINANQALAKVHQDDSRYVLKLDNQEIDVVEFATKIAVNVATQLFIQFNSVNQQNIQTENVIQYNTLNMDKDILIEDESLELEECQEDIIEESQETKIPKNYISDFKKVLNETKDKCNENYKLNECVELCAEYINIRFDPKYDVNKIHVFDRKRMRDYLVSFVFAYSKAANSDKDLNKFREEFEEWINSVKLGVISYTFPKSVSDIFFNILDTETKLDDDYIFGFKLWRELWDIGYYKFDNYSWESTFKLDKELSWLKQQCPDCIVLLNDLKPSTDTSYDDIFNISLNSIQFETNKILQKKYKSIIKEIYEQYCDFSLNPMYEVVKPVILQKYPELKLIHTISENKILEGTLCKSLIFYGIHNSDNLDEVNKQMDNINNISDKVNCTCTTYSEIEELLTQYDYKDLDLVEVFEYYVNNYVEACNV